MCFSDEYIQKNYKCGIVKHRSIIEKRDYPEDRGSDIFSFDHSRLRDKCKTHQADYFEIEGNYLEEMAVVEAYIDNFVAERRANGESI